MPKEVKEIPQDIADAKKLYKKLSEQSKKLDAQMAKVHENLLATYCPHKVGDKVIHTKRDKTQEEFYCTKIYLYSIGYPLKVRYEFSKTFIPNRWNESVNWIYKIEWIKEGSERNRHQEANTTT